MFNYDYKQEANKLKKKRKFAFKFFDEPLADVIEKKISKSHNLEEYRKIINEILDKMEKQNYKDKWDLIYSYEEFLSESSSDKEIYEFFHPLTDSD